MLAIRSAATFTEKCGKIVSLAFLKCSLKRMSLPGDWLLGWHQQWAHCVSRSHFNKQNSISFCDPRDWQVCIYGMYKHLYVHIRWAECDGGFNKAKGMALTDSPGLKNMKQSLWQWALLKLITEQWCCLFLMSF